MARSDVSTVAGATVVFFHAHPDDEAIFTGGTLRLLHDAGARTVVVLATGGERGEPVAGDGGADLGAVRAAETARAAAALGVDEVVHLGFGDSGMVRADAPPGSLVATPVDKVAAALAEVLVAHAATCLVSYDAHGIYGHPDHVAVHDAGRLAAEHAGIATRYDATVDREHLHFVATHVVEDARRAGLRDAGNDAAERLDLRALPTPGGRDGFGMPTVLIDLGVDVRPVGMAKRAAMACHASQIPPDSAVLRLDDRSFAEVYGTEWYLRSGPLSVLDALPQR